MDTVAITISDLEDTRQVLKACLTFFQAEDLQKAQVSFSAPRPSPLTLEIEQANNRLQNYLGDYLLHRHEALLDEEDDLDPEEDLEDPQDGSEELTEASEEEAEPLSDSPLGGYERPRSRGLILGPEDLSGTVE